MKYLLFLAIFLMPGLSLADDTTHHDAAMKLIDTVKVKDIMRDAYLSVIDNLNSTSSSVSPAENQDMKKAMIQWFDEDFKWEDLKLKMADIYVKAFSEDELNQLIAFYQTPLGEKTLAVLPEVMKEGAALGQDYAKSKQSLLTARLQVVHLKYHPIVTGAALSMPINSSATKPADSTGTPTK